MQRTEQLLIDERRRRPSLHAPAWAGYKTLMLGMADTLFPPPSIDINNSHKRCERQGRRGGVHYADRERDRQPGVESCVALHFPQYSAICIPLRILAWAFIGTRRRKNERGKTAERSMSLATCIPKVRAEWRIKAHSGGPLEPRSLIGPPEKRNC